ncbi:MAG: alcohol dehydrogenase catalytic domain-containing protein [Magnetococcus sp. DMHC-1]|nr:alcohol dehydrogenase catalytic domain-containing protein [Magnetococcales bacterium]
MRGLYWDGRWQLREDLPMPEVWAGEALLRVRLAGICGTDLEIARGYVDFQGIPGHEFVGEVVAAPDSDWQGRRVVGEINCVCGRCGPCQRQERSHCHNRTALGIRGRDGAFAEYCLLPLENLHPVPETMADTTAVFVEPLAAALAIVQDNHIRPADRVMVVGDGRLGQLVARVLRLTGCDLTVIGHHQDHLDLLTRLEIATSLEKDASLAECATLVVECTGHAAGFATARRLVRPRGTIVLKSTFSDKSGIDTTDLVVNEITLRGSRCGPFRPALRLLATGLVSVADLVEAVYPLSAGLAAIDHAQRPGVRKVLLAINPPEYHADRPILAQTRHLDDSLQREPPHG